MCSHHGGLHSVSYIVLEGFDFVCIQGGVGGTMILEENEGALGKQSSSYLDIFFLSWQGKLKLYRRRKQSVQLHDNVIPSDCFIATIYSNVSIGT